MKLEIKTIEDKISNLESLLKIVINKLSIPRDIRDTRPNTDTESGQIDTELGN